MKQIILVTALLLVGGAVAQADSDHFTNMLKHPRSEDVLHADAAYCKGLTGPNYDGVPTSAAYKSCMHGRGWRFDYTKVSPGSPTWIDPETGLRCRSAFDGHGSICGNP